MQALDRKDAARDAHSRRFLSKRAVATVLLIRASREIGFEVKIALEAGHSVRAIARSA